MNIPQTGPNVPRAKFFRECAAAFEFLALFHSLSEKDQLELMQHLTMLQSKGAK
jgi:hypothetical protein